MPDALKSVKLKLDLGVFVLYGSIIHDVTRKMEEEDMWGAFIHLLRVLQS